MFFVFYFVDISYLCSVFLITTMKREINYVNAEQKVAQILGHSKDLITLSLSLSQVLIPTVAYLLLIARAPAGIYGFLYNHAR